MLKLRNRRGAIALFTVLLFLAMMTMAAVVVDMARMQYMRNQLQTAADAAALAGAVQLLRTPKTDARAKAEAFGRANALMNTSVAIADSQVVYGNWNPATRQFTENGNDPFTADAVQVTVHARSDYIIANAFGWNPKPVAARAVAWAGPSVGKTDCMKPWAIWYGLLMQRINAYEGTSTDPTRPMTPDDLQALREMSEDQRTFTMFLGNSANGNVLNSGNFYAVDLPPLRYADGTTGTPLTGGDSYRDALAGVDDSGNPVCYQVGVGDVLQTETGAMVGPTKQGVEPAICATDAGNICLDENGKTPLIKSAFWTQATNKGSGKFEVTVQIIGSFALKMWDPKQAAITGVFQPIQDTGPVGSEITTLQRIVLVK
ncbi:MAG TPA: pilus assembly protein TadG-related protein [Gemmatimonadaceae bacterium]